jgi:hypothetical protein
LYFLAISLVFGCYPNPTFGMHVLFVDIAPLFAGGGPLPPNPALSSETRIAPDTKGMPFNQTQRKAIAFLGLQP